MSEHLVIDCATGEEETVSHQPAAALIREKPTGVRQPTQQERVLDVLLNAPELSKETKRALREALRG